MLGAGLAWREVAILRTYAKYLRQAGIAFSQDYMERVLSSYPAIARWLVDLFLARFDPALGEAASDARKQKLEPIEAEIAGALEGVATLDEDRILRRFLNAVRCSLRTNYWQPTAAKDWISIKIDSRAIDELPAPRPLVEIFVYSPRMEGIHLRGGRVARGGIRWSDRREDFRTEILGLMKTQMVKNAVIVPVGSKGGFYVKRPPVGGTREQVQAEGIACYQTLIRGLLDLTDNYAGGGIEPPADVVRHDPDDPYLVVAADKGTATFSDIANALAQRIRLLARRRLRLGRLGGLRPQEDGHHRPRRLGIGEAPLPRARPGHPDARPSPSPASATCRATCSATACCCPGTSSWSRPSTIATSSSIPRPIRRRAGTSASGCSTCRARRGWTTTSRCLSAGGGIYDRAAKSIALSAEARAVLGIEAPTMTPIDLMRAILAAPVDLLYFGGIGTYVKASSESHADAGDRASDALRINGDQVRAARGRRGRQSRLHPARPRRGGAGRPQDQHRRARQLGRRRHLGPRGQHQDRHRRGDQRAARSGARTATRCCSP